MNNLWVFLNISETGTISRLKCSNKTTPESLDARRSLLLFGTAATLKSSPVLFLRFRLQWFAARSSAGCCLDAFGACCIAVVMHGFTAIGGSLHFSGSCPVQQIGALVLGVCVFYMPANTCTGGIDMHDGLFA